MLFDYNQPHRAQALDIAKAGCFTLEKFLVRIKNGQRCAQERSLLSSDSSAIPKRVGATEHLIQWGNKTVRCPTNRSFSCVDNDSRITGLTYSAGSTQLGNLTYGYDADGRVTSKNGTLAAIDLPWCFSKPNPRKREWSGRLAWKITSF